MSIRTAAGAVAAATNNNGHKISNRVEQHIERERESEGLAVDPKFPGNGSININKRFEWQTRRGEIRRQYAVVSSVRRWWPIRLARDLDSAQHGVLCCSVSHVMVRTCPYAKLLHFPAEEAARLFLLFPSPIASSLINGHATRANTKCHIPSAVDAAAADCATGLRAAVRRDTGSWMASG